MSFRRSPSPRRRSPSPGGYPPRRYSRSPSPRYSPRRGPPPPMYGRRRYSRSPSPRGYRGRGGYRGGPRRYPSPQRQQFEREKEDSKTLFVGNLPYHFRERECAEVFERYGKVTNVTVGINRRTGQSKGYAFVEFADRREAEEAFGRVRGLELEGRALRVDWDLGIDKKVSLGIGGPPGGRGGFRRRSPPPRRYGSPTRRYSSRSPPPPMGERGGYSPRRRYSSRSPPPPMGERRGSPPYRGRSPSPRRVSRSPNASPRKRSRSPLTKSDSQNDHPNGNPVESTGSPSDKKARTEQ